MFKVCGLVVFSLIFSDAARILVVIPTPAVSHQSFFRPFIRELAKRGHNVVVFCVDPRPTTEEIPNVTEINLFKTYQGKWDKNVTEIIGKESENRNAIDVIYKVMYLIFKEQLKSDEFKKLADEKFDVLILEAWIRPPLILSHFFKAPVIQMASYSRAPLNYEDIGASAHPLLHPINMRQKSHNLSFSEKITETQFEFEHKDMIVKLNEEFDKWMKENFGYDMPSLNELSDNINVMFLNVHPIWEGNHAVPANLVHTWGIYKSPKQEFSQDLKSFLDSSTNGVIYMSFGSIVEPSLLSHEKIKMFINVFSQLPYDILWKWDKDELRGRTKNIKIGKWFPQANVLEHPKIKLFITQGGIHSIEEAINAGVPMIGIPMLGDQWYNTEKFVHHKIGLQLHLEAIDEVKLKNAISTVIADKSYRANIARLRSLMRDQPMQPLERAVWWTEHVLRHGGGAHLRAPAANISWVEYYQIDLIIILLLILLSLVVFVVRLWHCLCLSTFELLKKLQ